MSSLISVVCTGLWGFILPKWIMLLLHNFIVVHNVCRSFLTGTALWLILCFICWLLVFARQKSRHPELIHISQMFDVVCLHSCLLFRSSVDTASGPASDFHVYLFFPLPFFFSPCCWKAVTQLSNCSFSLSAHLFLSSLWSAHALVGEATRHPVWLCNWTEIRPVKV